MINRRTFIKGAGTAAGLLVPDRSIAERSVGRLLLDGGGGSYPNVPGYYNFNAANMKSWNTAKAAVNAGIRNAKLLVLGDHQVVGAGAGAGAGPKGFTGAKVNSWPNQMASLLSVHASTNSFVGTNVAGISASTLAGSLASVSAYDPTLTFGAGWVNDGALTVGGGMPCNGIGPYTANGMSWVPTTNCDTFEIHVATYSTGIVLNANLDGGATLGSVNCYQAANPYPEQKFTVTGSLGVHTLNLLPASSSGGVWPIMIIGTNSAVKEVSILNGGWYAATAAQIATLCVDSYGIANWNPLPGIVQIAPDLTIIMVGSMDAYQATPLPTFTENLQLIISAALLSGSVILVSNAPFGTIVVSTAVQKYYISAMKTLAFANNIPFIDVFYLMYAGSRTLASNRGLTYSGAQHLSRFDRSLRLTPRIFARKMEPILTEADIVMFYKTLSSVFGRGGRRAQAHEEHLAANDSEYNLAGYALVAGWVATSLNGFC